jgi:hypothetical protein
MLPCYVILTGSVTIPTFGIRPCTQLTRPQPKPQPIQLEVMLNFGSIQRAHGFPKLRSKFQPPRRPVDLRQDRTTQGTIVTKINIQA